MNINEKINLNDLLIDQRIVFLIGEITQEVANDFMLKLLYLASLDAEKDIKIYLNTPGGDTNAMSAIIDVMKFVKNDIAIVNLSCAYSAGSLILANGTKGKRYMLPSAKVMIHQVSLITGKNKWNRDELTDVTLQILDTQNYYINSMIDNTKMTREQLLEFMNKDTYLNARECIELGIIDKILED